MLKRLFLCLFLVSTSLGAQTTPSPNLAGIAHIALRVKDLDASVAFYEKLGFVKAFDLSRDGKVYEAFIKINDRQFIELYPVDAKNTQVGFLHVCFEANDIQSVHDFYIAQGLKPIDVRKAGAGNLLFTMPGPLTPQGAQNMEYTQYLPGSLHSNDAGKHLGPDRIGTNLISVALAADDPDTASRFYAEKIGSKITGRGNSYVTQYLIPGTDQTVDILSDFSLGFKARFSLQVDDRPAALQALTKRGFKIAPPGAHYVLSDPDGNQIDFQRSPADFRLEQ